MTPPTLTPWEIIGTIGGSVLAAAVALYPFAKKLGNGLGLVFGGRLARIEEAARLAASQSADAASKAAVSSRRVDRIATEIGADDPETPSLSQTVQKISENVAHVMAKQHDDHSEVQATLKRHGELFEKHDARLRSVESNVKRVDADVMRIKKRARKRAA